MASQPCFSDGLLHQAQGIAHDPAVYDLVARHSEDGYTGIGYSLVGRRDAEQLPPVCASIGKTRDHLVSFSNQLLNLVVKVRKGGADQFDVPYEPFPSLYRHRQRTAKGEVDRDDRVHDR